MKEFCFNKISIFLKMDLSYNSRDWRDSIRSKALAMHSVNPGLFPALHWTLSRVTFVPSNDGVAQPLSSPNPINLKVGSCKK